MKNSKAAKRWQNRDGVVYFSVTSDGTSGTDWITRLERKGFRVEDGMKAYLRSDDFKQTVGVTYKIAVLRATSFDYEQRLTKYIRYTASFRGLLTPNVETSCLIREMFTDTEIQAMNLEGIVVMCKMYRGFPCVADGGLEEVFDRDSPDVKWRELSGFAFDCSQVP